MVDYSQLVGPLPLIDIEGLAFEDAIERVVQHVGDCLSKIPPEPTNGVNSGGPAAQYRRRLIYQVSPVIVKLLDQKPGADEGFVLLKFTCDRLLELPGLGSGTGSQGAWLGAEFRTRILRDHNERDAAQYLLIRLAESFSGTSDSKRWDEVYLQSRLPQTKLVAALKRWAYRSSEFQTICQKRLDRKTYEKKMKEYQADINFIKQALPDFETKKSPYVLTQFAQYLNSAKFRLRPNKQNQDWQEIDEERVSEVNEMLDSVLEMVDRVKGD